MEYFQINQAEDSESDLKNELLQKVQNPEVENKQNVISYMDGGDTADISANKND